MLMCVYIKIDGIFPPFWHQKLGLVCAGRAGLGLLWGCWGGQNPSLMWEELVICPGTLGTAWAAPSQPRTPAARPCGLWGAELWL